MNHLSRAIKTCRCVRSGHSVRRPMKGSGFGPGLSVRPMWPKSQTNGRWANTAGRQWPAPKLLQSDPQEDNADDLHDSADTLFKLIRSARNCVRSQWCIGGLTRLPGGRQARGAVNRLYPDQLIGIKAPVRLRARQTPACLPSAIWRLPRQQPEVTVLGQIPRNSGKIFLSNPKMP